MRLGEPRWWYASGPAGIVVAVLRPAARAYGWAAERRLARATAWRSRLPVICVGNFTAGGTGKTPLALRIADELAALGERPALLTRGYGGRLRGPHWVERGRDTAGQVGDEALLLAERAPTVVAADRRAGAQAIEAGAGGLSAIVMDDGLQNPALAKDLAIAVVDGVRGIGNGEIIPAGPLRAPLACQLRLADAIVVNGGPAAGGERPAAVTDWFRRHFTGPVLEAAAQPGADAAWLAGTRVLAYAGIGHPERFFAMLSGLGAELCAAIPFADHHEFAEQDAERLLGLARSRDAMPVTTAKDLARLAGTTGRRGELYRASRALPIRLELAERDAERLRALLAAALAARRRAGSRSDAKASELSGGGGAP